MHTKIEQKTIRATAKVHKILGKKRHVAGKFYLSTHKGTVFSPKTDEFGEWSPHVFVGVGVVFLRTQGGPRGTTPPKNLTLTSIMIYQIEPKEWILKILKRMFLF